MKLVLITDVIRSGLQSAGGASRLLLCGVADRAFVPLVTVATILEHEEVRMRLDSLAATRLAAEETPAFLDGFLALCQRVPGRRRGRPSLQDPADEIFVEALGGVRQTGRNPHGPPPGGDFLPASLAHMALCGPWNEWEANFG